MKRKLRSKICCKIKDHQSENQGQNLTVCKVVRLWMEALSEMSEGEKPRREVRRVIEEAYDSNYHEVSDGCSYVDEFGWGPLKNPTCVGHDHLYFKGELTRLECDVWFLNAMIDFGHPLRGRLRYWGVRAFGWLPWRKHRKREVNKA